MSKRELKLWREAVWYNALRCPYRDGRVFFEIWYGALIDGTFGH